MLNLSLKNYKEKQWKVDFRLIQYSVFLLYRWDDDVVFKNCAKGEDDKKVFCKLMLLSKFYVDQCN